MKTLPILNLMNTIPTSFEDQIKTCLKITDIIISHPLSALFLEPVDPEKDDAPGYYEKIKNPKTLSEVRSNLLDKKYASVSDWKDDIKLIWSNAILYGGEQSIVSKLARQMEKFANKLILSKLPLSTYDWIDSIGTYVTKLKTQYSYAAANNEFLAPLNSKNKEYHVRRLCEALPKLTDEIDRVQIGRILALFDAKYETNEANTINLNEIPLESLNLLIVYTKYRFDQQKLQYPD